MIIRSPVSSSSTTGPSAVADLQFNAERHEYTVNGARVPSVTQILKAEGFTPNYGSNAQAAAQRGTMVHALTVKIDKWQDTGTSTYLYQKYITAYIRFISAEMPQWTEIEERSYSDTWGFAGTIDRRTENQIWDIKTGKPTAANPLQLAGYALLYDDRSLERWNLYLHDDGTYDAVQHEDKKDFVVFTNALYNYAWKKHRGIK